VAFALQIKQNHGLHYVALLSHAPIHRFSTKRYAPAITHRPAVLPDFIRSLSAVEALL
jgi:hypothetical protein